MNYLEWHEYKYYPYERELAAREVRSLLGATVGGGNAPIALPLGTDFEAAGRLTYFSRLRCADEAVATMQALLEDSGRSGKNRQATRYSVHGLHEYKGKFNPQVAKALMNIFGVGSDSAVLDPFCGSGTTLVEAAQLGAQAHGVDVNPLAIYVAGAKLAALRTPTAELKGLLSECLLTLREATDCEPTDIDDARTAYLKHWFDGNVLALIERLRSTVERVAGASAPILLTVASDLLRDYSLQEPQDLRIRRRKSPRPEEPLLARWERDCRARFDRIAAAQALLPSVVPQATIKLGSAADAVALTSGKLFDAAITSPPYAMALPYIDTQRLSLVWLGLTNPSELASLEATLIGSREIRGAGRRTLQDEMMANAAGLPHTEAKLCWELQQALSDADGFRRQAVPVLLYRYFVGMMAALSGILNVMKPNAPFALIVGHNHTTLGGRRFEIDTPKHLANLAVACGWMVEELMPMQAYKRYGLHALNAVADETLVILRAPVSG